MLRIIDRYLARQIFTTTLFAVVMLSVVLVLGQIFKKLLDQMVDGVMTVELLVKFIACALPMSLSITLPWGVLTAVLLTFGRLSADNELISLRMAGLSLRRICLPVFVLALTLSGICYWLNTTVTPAAATTLRKLTQEAVLQDPSALFVADRPIDTLKGYRIYFEKQEGETMKNLTIAKIQNSNGRTRLDSIILAKEGRLDDTLWKTSQNLGLLLKGTRQMDRRWPPLDKEGRTVIAPGAPDVVEYGTDAFSIDMPVTGLSDGGQKIRTKTLPTEELVEAIDDHAAFTKKYETTSVPSHSEFRTEYHKRISFSLACLVLTLVGIPFGITAQRRETSSGFVLSLIVGIIYFALITLGDLWQDKPEMHPVLWVWLPNVLFGVMGILLFLRMQKR